MVSLRGGDGKVVRGENGVIYIYRVRNVGGVRNNGSASAHWKETNNNQLSRVSSVWGIIHPAKKKIREGVFWNPQTHLSESVRESLP